MQPGILFRFGGRVLEIPFSCTSHTLRTKLWPENRITELVEIIGGVAPWHLGKGAALSSEVTWYGEQGESLRVYVVRS